MSSPNSVTEQGKTPPILSLQDGSKYDQGGVENSKGVDPRPGGDLEEDFTEDLGVSQKPGKTVPALDTSFRRFQARRPSSVASKVIASSIKFQCLFFPL